MSVVREQQQQQQHHSGRQWTIITQHVSYSCTFGSDILEQTAMILLLLLLLFGALSHSQQDTQVQRSFLTDFILYTQYNTKQYNNSGYMHPLIGARHETASDSSLYALQYSSAFSGESP